jgi:hypothetical protein
MSKEVKKITEEELEKVVNGQNELAKAIQNVGILETEKHAVLHVIAGVKSRHRKN